MIEVWKDPNYKEVIPHVGWVEDKECNGCMFYVRTTGSSVCKAVIQGKECPRQGENNDSN